MNASTVVDVFGRLTLFTLLAPGRQVVSIRDTYGGTNRLFTEFLPRWGVANAQAVAEFLASHSAVAAVFYPGLPGHPGRDVARRQMRWTSTPSAKTRRTARRSSERMRWAWWDALERVTARR